MGIYKRESAFALTFGVGTVDWFEPLRGMQRWRGVAHRALVKLTKRRGARHPCDRVPVSPTR